MTIITDTTTDTGILDDDVLLERIKRDDQAAFSMLMERYRDTWTQRIHTKLTL